jgi:ferritin
MISKEMAEALNSQINAELYSSYLYLSMSAYASDIGLPGTAHWFFMQAREELMHVEKFFQYMNSQGARVVLQQVDQPPSDFESVLQIFEQSLEHEQLVTGRVNALATLAREQNDHATEIMLQWFVSEQVEEEETFNDVLSQLRLAGGEGAALFMIDKELAKRMPPVPPA